jgi:RNA polymerase sigma-70 factor (family 1)
LTPQEFKISFDQDFDAIRNYIYYKSNNTDLATDIAQDTFLKIWEKQIPFHPTKTKSLLYKIAGDLFISHLRKTKIEDSYLETIQLDFKSEPPDNSLYYKDLKGSYEKALSKLSEKQRNVFLMSRIDGLTYKEIAQHLEISIKAVEKRMSNALSKLKKMIQL